MRKLGSIVIAGAAVFGTFGCGTGSGPDQAVHLSTGQAPIARPAPEEVQAAAIDLRALYEEGLAACAVKDEGLDPKPIGDAPTEDELRSGPIRVGGGPECESGLVSPTILDADDPTASDAPHPISAIDSDRVIGYWVNGIGWLPVEVVEHQDFDLAAWREAEQLLAADPPPAGDAPASERPS